MGKEKKHINIVVIGHVDSGKSTITGHLVYKCGGVDQRAIEKFEKEAQEMGKGFPKYSWVLDKLKAERERGVNSDIALCKFETTKYYVTIFDAPGHRDLIKNMIPGIAQADCAVLVVTAGAGEFEAGISQHGQTRNHVLLAFALGVNQLIVGVNKMDSTEPPYSEARFEEVNKEVNGHIRKIGYNPAAVAFVPISGHNGDNMLEVSEKMPWFRGWSVEGVGVKTGKCLFDALDAIRPPNRPFDKVLRPLFQNVQKIDSGSLLVGFVEDSNFKRNSFVIFHVKNVLRRGVVAENNNPGYSNSVCISIGFNVIQLLIRELSCGFVNGDANNNPFPGDELGFGIKNVLAEEFTRVFSEFPPLGRFVLRERGQIISVGVIKNINFNDSSTGRITELAEKDQKKK